LLTIMKEDPLISKKSSFYMREKGLIELLLPGGGKGKGGN